jgi:restriction endonuclease Mrr
MEILVFFGVIGALIAAVTIYQKIEAHINKNKPCVHHIKRARQNPALCSQCTADAADRERKLAQEEARRKAELEEQKRQWLEKVRTIAFLQQLHPNEFQLLVWSVFRSLGWTVEETPFGHDGGVDGFIARGSERLVLQCKRYRHDVGEPVVRDLYGTYLHQGATGAVLITTGAISRHAKEFVAGKKFQLYDGKEFLTLLNQAKLTTHLVPDSFVLRPGDIPRSLQKDPKQCPLCGSKLRLRSGKYGKFYGCSQYPNCRYTRDARRVR